MQKHFIGSTPAPMPLAFDEQRRSETIRHEREKLDRLMMTCSRCGEWCEADNGAGGGSFLDWCLTCGRRLCGTCAKKGCCGHVPMQSGVDQMFSQPVIYGPEIVFTNSENIRPGSRA